MNQKDFYCIPKTKAYHQYFKLWKEKKLDKLKKHNLNKQAQNKQLLYIAPDKMPVFFRLQNK